MKKALPIYEAARTNHISLFPSVKAAFEALATQVSGDCLEPCV